MARCKELEAILQAQFELEYAELQGIQAGAVVGGGEAENDLKGARGRPAPAAPRRPVRAEGGAARVKRGSAGSHPRNP